MFTCNSALAAILQAQLVRRRAALLPAAVLVLAMAEGKPSRAQISTTFNWNNPAGGDYNASANWTPTGIPNSSIEQARFNLDATYAVAMPQSNVSVQGLSVPQGDVTLNFHSPSFEPIFAYTANLSASVGSSVPGRLSTVGGVLSSGTTTLGGDVGSEGRLTLDRTSKFSSGATVIGGAGSGRLEVLAGAIPSPSGGIPAQSEATTGATVLGQSATGSGRADVGGIWQTGDLIVGDAGNGEVNVWATTFGSDDRHSAGRLQSGAASIAAQTGSSGLVAVFGSYTTSVDPISLTGSEWNVGGSLTIGGSIGSPGGAGRLFMGARNKVTVSSIFRVWPSGRLELTATNRLITSSSNIFVSGTAILDGHLDIDYGPPDDAQIGEAFEIITATGGVTGRFSTTSPLGPRSGLAWKVDYNPTSVVLRLVAASSFAAADFDEDGDVDGDDLAQWQGDFGVNGFSDADNDGDSDGADFLAWQRQVGTIGAAPASSLVAEPATSSMAALKFVAIILRARMARLYSPANLAGSSVGRGRRRHAA